MRRADVSRATRIKGRDQMGVSTEGESSGSLPRNLPYLKRILRKEARHAIGINLILL
jgi:hypothetical protein